MKLKNVDIALIKEITGLPEAEIEKLQGNSSTRAEDRFTHRLGLCRLEGEGGCRPRKSIFERLYQC